MLEPPSAQLLKTLSALKLCTPRDLRKCRAYVRRLTRDLPTFDSIWIDGLVQTRRITAFQAQCLESGKAETLVIGPCLLLEKLGATALAETYLARRRDADDICMLKLTSVAPENVKLLSERLNKLTTLAAEFDHPAIVLPQATQVAEWPSAGKLRLVTISRHIRGPNLSELLIRRGRFPIPIVVELGRQLLDGLAALEARGLVHGDISLSNVRVTPKGQAVLVDAGIVTALRPEFSFHTILSAERYNGMAPERITTGEVPTAVSDLYALGCLLWHLLAGRPPFTDGDPLAKLAAHQTRPVPDVREWVPDVPVWLADSLRNWTAISPSARPKTIREAAVQLGAPTRSGRRQLAHYRGEFDRTAPRRERVKSNSGWPLTVAVLFVLTGAALSMFDQGARNYVLSLAKTHGLKRFVPGSEGDTTEAEPQKKKTSSRDLDQPAFLSESATESQESAESLNGDTTSAKPVVKSEPQPLPPPNTKGRIDLPASGRFLAAAISVKSGLLEIVGDEASPAEILVSDESLSLWAERIQLRHIRVIRESSTSKRPPALLVADSQQLQVIGCRFEQDPEEEKDHSKVGGVLTMARNRGAAIAWRPREAKERTRSQDRAPTNICLQDCVFSGAGPAVFIDSPPKSFTATNVLKVGAGEFLQFVDRGGFDWRCELRQFTLRDSGPLLRWWPRTEETQLSHVALTAEGCVFDLASRPLGMASASATMTTSANRRAALIAWVSKRLPTNWESAIDWEMSAVLVGRNIDMVVLIDPKDGRRQSISETKLNIDGILAAPFEFVGSEKSRSRDSQLKSFDAPLPSPVKVGIQVNELGVE